MLVSLAMRGTRQMDYASPVHINLSGPEIQGILFNKHQPIRIANVWSDDPQSLFFRSLLQGEAFMLLEGIAAWIWVPLAVKGRLIGGLCLGETRQNYFTTHHADLALSVANQAAIAMINADLYRHAQTLAVLEERQRLARDLHDAVNQSIFSAGLIAEVLPRLWERDQAGARQSLEDLRRLLRSVQAEMRALLAELRPSTLTDSNLRDLLRLLGNAFSGRTNIPVKVTATGECPLPTDVHIAFYRVCQEALNNIAKHAKASQVQISLKQTDAIIEMGIHDDGQGFDPKQAAPGHYGLIMIRERAEAVGARFSVISQPGHGTEIIIRWMKALPKELM
jgi:two-component system nitrate/nitrite sensor histidine kinase NarX